MESSFWVLVEGLKLILRHLRLDSPLLLLLTSQSLPHHPYHSCSSDLWSLDPPGYFRRKPEACPIHVANVGTWWLHVVSHWHMGVLPSIELSIIPKRIGLKQQILLISASGVRHLRHLTECLWVSYSQL